jgi:hypothetical protein
MPIDFISYANEQVADSTGETDQSSDTAAAPSTDGDSPSPGVSEVKTADTGSVRRSDEVTSVADPVDEDEARIQASWDEFAKESPQNQKFVKEMRNGLRELREKDKSKPEYQRAQKVKDLDDQALEAYANFRQTAKTNPALAREMLKRDLDMLDQHLGIQQPQSQSPVAVQPSALEAWEPQSLEAEQLKNMFLQEVNALKDQFTQNLNPLKQTHEEMEYAKRQLAIERDFDSIGKKFNTQLSPDDRKAIANYCYENGIANLEAGYKAYNYDNALKTGFQQGQKVIAAKQTLPAAPQGLVDRTPPTPKSAKPTGKGFKQYAEWQLSQSEDD